MPQAMHRLLYLHRNVIVLPLNLVQTLRRSCFVKVLSGMIYPPRSWGLWHASALFAFLLTTPELTPILLQALPPTVHSGGVSSLRMCPTTSLEAWHGCLWVLQTQTQSCTMMSSKCSSRSTPSRSVSQQALHKLPTHSLRNKLHACLYAHRCVSQSVAMRSRYHTGLCL